MGAPRVAGVSGALRRALLALGGALVGAGTLEALLLLGGFVHAPRADPFERAFAGGRVDGYRVHERDARELWRPVPGARLPWSGDVLDAAGFRGRGPARERRAGVARIAVLGGSAAIGRGVGADEAFVVVAARELGARGVACEALNAGVVGASVVQARARWEQAVRAWAPDVVLLAFSGVEEHAPALGAPDAELVRTGAVAPGSAPGPFARLARDSKVGQLARWVVSGCAAADTQDATVEAQLDRVGAPDWPGARRVSLDEARAGVRELAESVRSAGATLVLVALPARPTNARAAPVLAQYAIAVAEEARALGVEVLDARADFAAAVAAGQTYADLFAGPAEPAQAGHLVIGHALAERLAAKLGGR